MEEQREFTATDLPALRGQFEATRNIWVANEPFVRHMGVISKDPRVPYCQKVQVQVTQYQQWTRRTKRRRPGH